MLILFTDCEIQHIFTLDKHEISLITYGRFGNDFLEKLSGEVADGFGLPVVIHENYSDLSACFDPARRQYNANQLLKLVDIFPTENSVKKIGLFQVDLFIPILTFIFGQAEFKGKNGVASVYRLRNEQYGLRADNKILAERFSKVVLHELGHAFGLIHCHVPNCVMRPSTYVEDIDQKKPHFCNKCREELNLLMG